MKRFAPAGPGFFIPVSDRSFKFYVDSYSAYHYPSGLYTIEPAGGLSY